jgi:hypothetical protein
LPSHFYLLSSQVCIAGMWKLLSLLIETKEQSGHLD